MAYSALSAYLQTQFNFNVTGPVVSSSLSLGAPAASATLTGKTSYGLGGNAANAINSVATGILAVSASSSATLNLQSLTDILGATGVVWVRLKEYFFGLLSAAQDTVNGTACSSVTIGAAGSNANNLDLGGTTPTRTLLNGDQGSYATGSAGGITVDATHKNVLVTNNDGSHAAAVLYGLGGATS